MAAATATVEVLTAEVRVLVVGRRQITMSVYRQLDTVEPEHIEPFGRVKDEGPGVSVIGRIRDGLPHAGTLACSYAPARRWRSDPAGTSYVHRGNGPEHGHWEPNPYYPLWRALPLIILAGLR